MMDLSPEERAVLRALHSEGGHSTRPPLPTTAAALRSLEERGLTYRGPGGGWWLTGDGQAVVEAEM